MHSKPPNFRRPASLLLAGTLLLTGSCAVRASGQSGPTATADTRPVKTFYLNGRTSTQELSALLTGVRLMLEPTVDVYLDVAQRAMLVRGTQAQIDLAGKLIADMDRPQQNYKLIFTMTEMDGSKHVGVQHYSLDMFGDGSTTLKQGSKIPIATGTITSSGSGANTTQFTFVDVGINIDATLDASADGVRLQSKVEQSGLLEDRTVAGIAEPIIRQTVLQGTSLLQPGRPLALGSLDVPGSTRHLDVEVLLTPMP